MPVISDINPNSLGPLQPIRAPQVPVSIPNPLSVAPFFQGQQLQQNERRLDQQDIAMALQEKQFDLAMSDLVFRQTKEILDMGDMSVENAYNEHTSRQSSQGGSGYGSQLGLDMGYKKHVELAEKANARIGDFESKMLSGLAGTLKGGDPKGMNMLLADLSKGLIENRRALQNDPEYIKYAVQHQKFNRFLKGTAAEIAKGNSVDELQYRRTEQLYKKFADGEHLTLRETQELDEMLSNSNIQAMTFNQEKGLKWLKDTIDAAAAPILEEEGIDTNDPRLPGYGIVKSKKTWADPADVMHEVVRAAAVNEDLIKMFKAATGLDIRDKKNYGAFANWVAVQAKPYLHPGGQFTTDVGEVIVDPTEVLKSRAAARGTDSTTTGSPFTGNTESERQADRYYNDLLNKGLEIPPGELSGVAAIAALKANNPGSILEETDPDTGEVKVWRVKVDAQGNPITEVKYDADNKEIPNSEHIVKVGQPLLVLRKRTTTAPAAGDDIGSQNNNPGNIRATPEQIRRGTVRVDNNGFIIFDTIEQGLEASAADNEAKISGNSEAMRNSPYMVNKYGKDALANYQDFATVEDLLNVRTPRAAVGGDNTNVQVDSFLTHLENRGFPRDLKLKELNDVEKQALNKAIVEFESPSSYARLFNPKPAETTTTPEASTEGETSTPNAPDAVQTRLLSGGDFSPEELVTELQAIGEDIPGDRYVNRFGIPGPSTFSKIGEVNADLQKAQDVVSAFDVEYSVKNKIREEKGEPLLDKTQDKEYKKAVAELNKLQTYQSKLVREFAPQAKDLLIERKFPEESAESYRLYSEAIVDTLVTSIIDLEAISDLKGSMTESTVDGSEVIIKEIGKKPLRISKSELPNWVRQHARRSAFASTDPIELRRGRVEAIQQPTTTPTAPATPVPQTTGVITGSATGKKY